jgi:hypothetical protein
MKDDARDVEEPRARARRVGEPVAAGPRHLVEDALRGGREVPRGPQVAHAEPRGRRVRALPRRRVDHGEVEAHGVVVAVVVARPVQRRPGRAERGRLAVEERRHDGAPHVVAAVVERAAGLGERAAHGGLRRQRQRPEHGREAARAVLLLRHHCCLASAAPSLLLLLR